jgi:hypothetical protein
MIKCRCCKGLFDDKDSRCSICKSFKREWQEFRDNIEIEEYDGSLEVQLKPVHQQTMRMIKELQKRLEKEIFDAPVKVYNDAHASQLKKMTEMVEKVIKEGRALEKQERAEAQNLSLDKKIELLVKFVEKLPSEKQAKVQAEIFKAVNGKDKTKTG